MKLYSLGTSATSFLEFLRLRSIHHNFQMYMIVKLVFHAH